MLHVEILSHELKIVIYVKDCHCQGEGRGIEGGKKGARKIELIARFCGSVNVSAFSECVFLIKKIPALFFFSFLAFFLLLLLLFVCFGYFFRPFACLNEKFASNI